MYVFVRGLLQRLGKVLPPWGSVTGPHAVGQLLSGAGNQGHGQNTGRAPQAKLVPTMTCERPRLTGAVVISAACGTRAGLGCRAMGQ